MSQATFEQVYRRHVGYVFRLIRIVVWGTDRYSSYGYPAGGNARKINDVVVPPG